jgi:hypothetical protein
VLEGVSLNQLCVSLLSRGLGLAQARPVQSSAASAVDDCSDQSQPAVAQGR